MLTDRDNVIKLLNNMDDVNYSDVETKCRKYYGEEIKDYEYIPNTKYNTLETGKNIAFVDLDYSKLSFGLIANIKYTRGKIVKQLVLKSLAYGSYWKLNVNKYHIFQLNTIDKDYCKNILDELNISFDKN